MEWIISEEKEMMDNKSDPDAMDAGFIGAGQKVEHYKISGFGSARTLASCRRHTITVCLLRLTPDEEKLTDKYLTRLAESKINQQVTTSQ